MKVPHHYLRLPCLWATIVASFVSLINAQSQPLTNQVTVENNRLMRDGQSWVPHGFFQIGFAVPPGAFNTALPNGQPINPVYQIGYTNYSPNEYADMLQVGAYSVRINILQSAVDPDPGYYCNSRTPQATLEFLGYLQEHQIGLEVVAWDWGAYNSASAVQNFPKTVFSSFLTPTSPGACSAANGVTPGRVTAQPLASVSAKSSKAGT